jgi:SpoVK/Ycf46/Vps4 family AAA+-type ATPase
LRAGDARAARAQEAQRAQPAIIFFDEIDGLAPVRRPPPAPLTSPAPADAQQTLW